MMTEPGPDKCRLVLADDHALFRKGLRKILEGAADLEVIGEADDGLDLLNLLKKKTPDVIILDISMPHLGGIEAIHEIKRIRPDAKILIVTMHKDKEYLYRTISAGVDGYFLKKDADAELFSAIAKIRKGGMYVSPSLSDEPPGDWEQIRERFRKPILTPREREVMILVAAGKSNKEIGELLFISAHTVERHRANIMEKLSLRNTAELVRYAILKGYTS